MSRDMAQEIDSGGESSFNPALRVLPIPGIRRMVNLASSMEDVIHLSIGQPDFATPPHIVEGHIKALKEGHTGYTMDAGLPELIAELASYYSERYGCRLKEDNFLVTTGATEALYLALSATAAPGREFLIPEPTFPLYSPLVRMNGGEVKPIQTSADRGYQVDPQEVIDSIGMSTYAIVLNSPGNPTGVVYPRETIEAIVQEAAYRGVKVISDEVYDHLVLDDMEYPSVIRCAADIDQTMVVSSFSKTFSMPGMRIGWVIASEAAIKTLRRYHMFTTTVANTPAQWAGVAALTGDRSFLEDMIAEYRRRRDKVVQLVSDAPHLTGYWPQGAFYILPSLPVNADGSSVALRMLEETGVCTVPGDTFGESTANTFRISFSTSLEKIEEAFSRMIPWLEKQHF